MGISDWSSDVCSSDLLAVAMTEPGTGSDLAGMKARAEEKDDHWLLNGTKTYISNGILSDVVVVAARTDPNSRHGLGLFLVERGMEGFERGRKLKKMGLHSQDRSEEHTSELQSLMRISYAVFCLKKKKQTHIQHQTITCQDT